MCNLHDLGHVLQYKYDEFIYMCDLHVSLGVLQHKLNAIGGYHGICYHRVVTD